MEYSLNNARGVADRSLLGLLIFLGLFFYITMPGWICPSDAYVSRAESANIVMTGNYGIDFSQTEKLGEYSAPNMMIFNTAKGRYYSWYGILNSIVYIPALYIIKIITGKANLIDDSILYITIINTNNIIISLIAALYIYKIAALYTKHDIQKVSYVLFSVFSTNLWFYLRGQHHEIFQITTFLGFFYYFIIFFRASAESDESLRWKSLLLSSLWLAALLLTKVYYVVIIPIVFIFSVISGDNRSTIIQRIKNNISQNKFSIIANTAIPLILSLVVVLIINKTRTGMFLSTGYYEANDSFQQEIAFSFKALTQSVPALFLNKGNSNLFFNYPVFFFAIFGIRIFFTKRPFEAAFIGCVVVANFFILACFHGWDGGMSYGPRYYLPFLIVASLPFIEIINYIYNYHHRRLVFISGIIITALFAYSIGMQICVNSTGNFQSWFLEEKFKAFNDKDINEYFSSQFTRAGIYRDLLLYEIIHRKFYPVEIAKQRYIPAKEHAEFDDFVISHIDNDLMLVRLFSKQ